MMQIDEELYRDLMAYLMERPWKETNRLIVRLVQADEKPKIENPQTLESIPKEDR
jgi:hypothetical protein